MGIKASDYKKLPERQDVFLYLLLRQSSVNNCAWQRQRLARNRVLKFLNRFREEGFLSGKTGLRLLRDGTKAPHHLAPSVVQYQR